MWPIGESSCNWNLGCNASNSLAKEKKEKEKKKDNQYKLKKARAITIGLITKPYLSPVISDFVFYFLYI